MFWLASHGLSCYHRCAWFWCGGSDYLRSRRTCCSRHMGRCRFCLFLLLYGGDAFCVYSLNRVMGSSSLILLRPLWKSSQVRGVPSSFLRFTVFGPVAPWPLGAAFTSAAAGEGGEGICAVESLFGVQEYFHNSLWCWIFFDSFYSSVMLFGQHHLQDFHFRYKFSKILCNNRHLHRMQVVSKCPLFNPCIHDKPCRATKHLVHVIDGDLPRLFINEFARDHHRGYQQTYHLLSFQGSSLF